MVIDMYFRDQQFIEKLGLTVPEKHKYLSYVSEPLDLILFSDNLEAFKIFQEKYPDAPTERTLRACVEYGASSCFSHFFENTKSPRYDFENLFKKPENPILGVQCAYYVARNNDILKTINETCSKIFPDKTPLDLLQDREQIEYCAARFGIKGKTKLAEQLLDKLNSPIYIINNMHVFDYAYGNKAEIFCNIYLNKIEEKGMVEPFILSLFSRTKFDTNKKHINFFDKFTKEIINEKNIIHHVLNDFLIRNIKNGSIKPEFQELMMAYCIHNNSEDFKLLFNARPLEKQSLIATLKESWKFSLIQHDPYLYIKDRNTYGLNLDNNALKLFHYNEAYIDRWVSVTKELGSLELKNSISSLFCLAQRQQLEESLKILKDNINWEEKDSKGNNFAHYLAYFFEKVDKTVNNSMSVSYKNKLAFVTYIVEELPIPFGVRNNDGLAAGESLINTLRTSKLLSSSLSSEEATLKEVSKLEKTLQYTILNNDLSHKETSTKRIKI
jgi:hypothetical protein